MAAELLRVVGLEKAFEGVQALKGVSFDVCAGEVHALIGENGAGKSTLIKIITGAHQADAGTVDVAGQRVVDLDPLRARKLGIAVIYQQPALFPDLTVAENIALGLESGSRWRRVNWSARYEVAQRLLDRVGAKISPGAEVRELSMPEQQLVEIARALGAEAKLIIMDEPTASLSDREVDNLFRVMEELKSQGVGMIYISHRLEELPRIADRVTVLRDGQLVATRGMSEVNRGELVRLMVGRELSAVYPKVEHGPGEVVLETRQLGCAASGVHGVSLQLRAGEILGLAGLVGSGRTELARVLFGLTPADAGEMFLGGERVRIGSPAQAVGLGLAYVPEDRRRHGVILEMPVSANTTLGILRQISTWGWLDLAKEAEIASAFVQRLATKTASLDEPVGHLSGGNQQKVALARWLAARPRVLILDEPTQAVDVGAKGEIHRLMGELARQGLAILMISSELPEVLGMSDRVAVMCHGTIAGEMSRQEATAEKIMHLALGQGMLVESGVPA